MAASSANASPLPPIAIRMPPIEGPAICSAAGRTNWSRAFASTRSSSGTSCGTSAVEGRAEEARGGAVDRHERHDVPHLDRAGEAQHRQDGEHAPRTRSVHSMIRRRSNRSLITPPNSSVATCGSERANPTTDIAAGAPDSSYTCQASATSRMPSPISEVLIPVHSRRKSLPRSGSEQPREFTCGAVLGHQAASRSCELPASSVMHGVELVDLLVGVRRGHLDPEADLVAGHQG